MTIDAGDLRDLVQMAAESAGYPGWKNARPTKEATKAAAVFSNAAFIVLDGWVSKESVDRVRFGDELWGNGGAMTIWQTLNGDGTGIWDKWAPPLTPREVKSLTAKCKKDLEPFRAALENALFNAAYETGGGADLDAVAAINVRSPQKTYENPRRLKTRKNFAKGAPGEDQKWGLKKIPAKAPPEPRQLDVVWCVDDSIPVSAEFDMFLLTKKAAEFATANRKSLFLTVNSKRRSSLPWYADAWVHPARQAQFSTADILSVMHASGLTTKEVSHDYLWGLYERLFPSRRR